MAVLEVDSLRKTFVRGLLRRRTEALRGVSFAVEKGEIFGFLGPNGAGKTTTIKILMGLIFPSGGTAKVFGAEVGDRRAKERVGYLPENPYFYDYLNLRELLDMVGRLHGLDRSTRRRRADALIEEVGLADAARRPLRSYSKGMLQRAGLAQALIGEPELVVLDEPMSGLDPIGRKEVRDLMLRLRERGTTVFFSTHILSDATLLCDRVAIVVGGELRDTGPLGQLLSPGVERVEVLWTAPDELAEKLQSGPGTHSTNSEGRLSHVPDLAAANELAAAVIRGGGEVHSLVPHRQGLEELFVAEAKRPSA
ncbi:MAG TPA: ABC transporter ATP-binding protein [Nannocystaceae bacterium]|nr:ABC transporter ATP-binding protein [Nannocystaceae bacterium]